AIMDHGRVLKLGVPDDLVASLGADHVVEVSVNGSQPLEADEWRRIPGVLAARVQDGTVSLTVKEVHRAVPAVLEKLARAGAELGGLVIHHATLEDVFLALTGRHLRDE
ncbi:MAG: DUF4162 domain-containing protein, partial [Gemmatimonadetes bacterium]|nr:DUF4162 domain-containing protein [Gemmatimonadota bacterium]